MQDDDCLQVDQHQSMIRNPSPPSLEPNGGSGSPQRQLISTAVRRLAMLTILGLSLASSTGAPVQAGSAEVQRGSGLPVPRYVSLKADRVNLRNGPGTDYPTRWVYRRAGLPLEVVKEFEAWRQVRDADGTTGWILRSLLSGRRTALVLPWERKDGEKMPLVAIVERDSENAPVVVNVEPGVIADLYECDGRWCRVAVEQFKGYILQSKLWGVYQGERLK